MKSINDMQSQARQASDFDFVGILVDADCVRNSANPTLEPTLPTTDLFTILTMLNRIEQRLSQMERRQIAIADEMGMDEEPALYQGPRP